METIYVVEYFDKEESEGIQSLGFYTSRDKALEAIAIYKRKYYADSNSEHEEYAMDPDYLSIEEYSTNTDIQ